MQMYYLFLFGALVGMCLTLLVQDTLARLNAYRDRRQAEFEAAVQAAAAHRKAQADRDWDRMLESVKDPYA